MQHFYNGTMVCHVKNTDKLKEIHLLLKALNKIVKKPIDLIFGICNKFIRKLTDYFLMVLDLGTASFGNGSLFTQLKEMLH